MGPRTVDARHEVRPVYACWGLSLQQLQSLLLRSYDHSLLDFKLICRRTVVLHTPVICLRWRTPVGDDVSNSAAGRSPDNIRTRGKLRATPDSTTPCVALDTLPSNISVAVTFLQDTKTFALGN